MYPSFRAFFFEESSKSLAIEADDSRFHLPGITILTFRSKLVLSALSLGKLLLLEREVK